MGRFSTSVHLRHSERSRKRAVDWASAALIRALKEDGCVVEPDLTKASRRFALRAEKSWLSLYDEDQASEALARQLSKALETTALAVRISDSDALDFVSFDDGKPAGRLSRATKAKKVKDLVVFGPSLTEALRRRIRDALEAPCVIVDEPAMTVATLLGLSASDAFLRGFPDLVEAPDCLVLGFREPGVKLPRRATGPATLVGAFRGAECFGAIAGAVSWDVQTGYVIKNEGGPTRGVEVVLFGPAIEQQLVVPRALRVSHEFKVVTELAFEPSTERGRPCFRAHLPELEVPAKLENDFATPEKQMAAHLASELFLQTLLSLKKQGRGELRYSFRSAQKGLPTLTAHHEFDIGRRAKQRPEDQCW
jgi:hypothetical protein